MTLRKGLPENRDRRSANGVRVQPEAYLPQPAHLAQSGLGFSMKALIPTSVSREHHVRAHHRAGMSISLVTRRLDLVAERALVTASGTAVARVMPPLRCCQILTRAAEEGAKRALADVGLEGDVAALDIRDLRRVVDCIRLVRRTAMQTVVRMITTGVMLALRFAPGG